MVDKRVVLIVENDETSVEVLVELLSQVGIVHHVVFDSRRVIEAIGQLGQLDAVFLDLEMPGRNGYEVLAELQAAPELCDIPIIAYTSHLSEMSNARNAGFHSFLGKPLRGSSFRDQVNRIFNNQPVWDAR